MNGISRVLGDLRKEEEYMIKLSLFVIEIRQKKKPASDKR